MVNRKFGKILIGVVLVSIIFTSVYKVYAEINIDYYNDNHEAATTVDTSSTVNKKTLASVILDGLGSLVYGMATLTEYLVQKIFAAATGEEMFPWADLILFNAVPLLDINFLDPHLGDDGTVESGGTVVGLMKGTLQSLYGTIFGLAISFFSIAVLIMGIKLAVSTIATEKAKYKQAIWDWLVGLILLFTIHIFISFSFYLNEQLVVKASDIASTNIENGAMKISEMKTTSISDEELVNRFIMSQLQPSWLDDAIRATISGTVGGVVSVGLTVASGGTGTLPAIGIGAATATVILDWFKTISPATQTAMTNLQDTDNIKIAAQLLKEEGYTKKEWNCVNTDTEYWSWGTSNEGRIRDLSEQVDEINAATADTRASWVSSRDTSGTETNKNYYQSLIDVYDIAKLNKKKGISKESLITNLAQYFKEAAWGFGNSSWKANKIVFQNAFMYGILVVQSLIFLISYVKRLFYVLILAMMAPVVVVYDFFNKSIS